MTSSTLRLYNTIAARIDPAPNGVPVPAWDRDLDQGTMDAVENILNYYQKSEVQTPTFAMTGNIIQLSLGINQSLISTLPSDLHASAKKLIAHLSGWLADYAQATGTGFLSIEINMNIAKVPT